MRNFKKITLLFLIFLILLSIKAFATEGEVITFEGITIETPNVSEDIIESEDPLSPSVISGQVSKAVTDGEVGASINIIDNESISSIISKFSNSSTVIGIDVSRHQGTIDWKQVANSGVKFAMLRCGYRGTSYGQLFIDTTFEANAKSAIENGIYVGAYFYSTALNEQEALEEAVATVNIIKKYDIKYPVAYDFEDFLVDNNRTDNMSVEQINKNAKIFLDYVSSKGYKGTLYGSANYLNTKWNMNNFTNYDTWVAHYYVNKPNYSKSYQMWQYTDKAAVPGISGRVDVDVDYSYYSKWTTVSISAMAHVQDIGWMNYVSEGATIGTTGLYKRIEAYKLKLNTAMSGGIQYRSHVQDYGWEETWRSSEQISGTVGESKRVEAIQIKLTGDLAEKYDIYYRCHIPDYGWLDWAKNGESAGTEGLARRVESIQVRLVKKGSPAPGNTKYKFICKADVKYSTHVQDIGWMPYVANGDVAGTTGQSKRIESLVMALMNNKNSGGIEYKSHVEFYGWENNWKRDNALTGTMGESKRLEAIQIRLYGDMAGLYDIYYRVHVQDFGWLGWAKNGSPAGTEGYAKRIEGIQIKLVVKNGEAPGDTRNSNISRY